MFAPPSVIGLWQLSHLPKLTAVRNWSLWSIDISQTFRGPRVRDKHRVVDSTRLLSRRLLPFSPEVVRPGVLLQRARGLPGQWRPCSDAATFV